MTSIEISIEHAKPLILMANQIYPSSELQEREEEEDNFNLPPGWEIMFDDNGRIYYQDNNRRTTQWQPPPPHYHHHHHHHHNETNVTSNQNQVPIENQNQYQDPPPHLHVQHPLKPLAKDNHDHHDDVNDQMVYRDVFFLVLFYLVFAGVIILFVVQLTAQWSYYNSNNHNHHHHHDNENHNQNYYQQTTVNSKDVKRIGYFLLISTLVSIFFILLWLAILRNNALFLIKFSLFAELLFFIVLTIIAFFANSIIFGIIMIIITIIMVLYIKTVWDRIPFTVAVLRAVNDCIDSFPVLLTLPFYFALFQIFWIVLWAFTAGLTFSSYWNQTHFDYNGDYVNNNHSKHRTVNAAEGFLWLYLIFALLWVCETVKNTLHVTICGTAGTYYFANTRISNPTWKSFVRAVTTSFGSIALGSLIVSILRLIRFIARLMLSSSERSRNIFAICCACCCYCFISIIEQLVEYFNHFAYVEVAIYGKSFITAAKDTFKLIKNRGIDAIINRCLVDGMLFIGSFLGGALVAISIALWTSTTFASNNSYWVLWAIAGFLFGYYISLLIMTVVDSASITFFICFAVDPAALSNSNPLLYREFLIAWRQLSPSRSSLS